MTFAFHLYSLTSRNTHLWQALLDDDVERDEWWMASGDEVTIVSNDDDLLTHLRSLSLDVEAADVERDMGDVVEVQEPLPGLGGAVHVKTRHVKERPPVLEPYTPPIPQTRADINDLIGLAQMRRASQTRSLAASRRGRQSSR